jgi:hypothetical protein
MSAELGDDQLINVLSLCDQYATNQKLLGEKLSSGLFQILQARKNSAVSVDNIRQDFDSIRHLEHDNETGAMKLTDEGNFDDCLLMFSALPPPALRRAQNLFTDSLQIAIKLAATLNEIDLEAH